MVTRRFDMVRFLMRVYQSTPFREYCKSQHLTFPQPKSASPSSLWQSWQKATRGLSPEQQQQIEHEFALISEVANAQAVDRLNEALRNPPPITIPAGAPLALWCFLHEKETFRFLLLRQGSSPTKRWHHAQTQSRLSFAGESQLLKRFQACLKKVYSHFHSGSFFTAVELLHMGGSIGLLGQVSDRLRYLDSFDKRGKPIIQALIPVNWTLVVYSPKTGELQIQTPFRSQQRIDELLTGLEMVFQAPVQRDQQVFQLDRLREPIPHWTSKEVTALRVRHLHLRFRALGVGRIVKLETGAEDHPNAIWDLLKTVIDDNKRYSFRIIFAEFQVKVLTHLGCRTLAIKLWPNRSNLPEPPLGDTIHNVLFQIGLCHAQ